MSITELAIKRPSLIVVIFSVLGFLGILTYSKLNYELMPKFSIPVVTVTTAYPGASPAEVENSVTKKMEDALSGLEGLDKIQSTSMEGVSTIVLQLKNDADPDKALQEAQRKINAMLGTLPEEISSPSLGKFSFDEAPIMNIAVTANMSPTELYSLVKDDISPMIAKMEGAAQVSMVGGEEREINVKVDREACANYGISILQITTAVRNANLELPTGKVKGDDSQALLRLRGKYKNLKELEQLPIANDPKTGSIVRLNELATISDASAEIKTYNRLNGTNSLGMQIQKQTDANAVELSKDVKEAIKELEKQYKKQGLKFKIASDSSDFTLAAADAVVSDLGLAIFIVALVMLLFLHSVRNSLIIMISIPASLISVFIAMYLLGYSLNLMTLLAISLVVGILVDDSIVVLENIYRHLEMGKERRQAALDGRNEIGFTAMGITLVDVVVFLPLTMVGGLISNLLSQFSIVIVISTLMSLFVSFTLTPLLASRMAKVEKINPKLVTGKIVIAFEKFLKRLTTAYGHMLAVALRRKRYIIIGALAALILSFSLVGGGYIGGEFVSQGDRGEFVISLELPQDATLQQTNAITQQVEDYLFHDKRVVSVFTNVGTGAGNMGTTNASTNKSQLTVKLVDKDKRDKSAGIIAQLMKQDLEKRLPDVKVNSAAVGIMGGADDAPIQIAVTGNSMDSNFVAADIVVEKLKSIKGTAEVKLSIQTGNPEITVNIDRDKMADLGLTMDVVGATLQQSFNGDDNSKYSEGGKDYDILVNYDDFDRKNVSDVQEVYFINSRGEEIKLSQFAMIGKASGPSKLERMNRIPSITITSQVLGTSSSQVTDEFTKKMEKITLPGKSTISFEGDAKNMAEAFANLGFAILASILFVYLIMVALYDSYAYPFVVLFSIPMAIIGALLGLALSMEPISIFSMLGMIMLIGLVAKNAILIVDFANQKKAEGHNTVDALLISGQARLRPILMTTLAMVFGMMPIALAHGAGAEWKSGLAWVLIGGLTSSMLLTLIVVPCVYLIFDIFKREIRNKNAKQLLKEADIEALGNHTGGH
jgi:hydrophobic/amphiphilic exporter-1 (mainly G- bacteria), HAE1 family